MALGNSGETYQERSKGKDVRTSNIVAAKVRKSKAHGTASYSNERHVQAIFSKCYDARRGTQLY
jgi:hypothetical protein